MSLYWLCHRLNNQISVVIEPGASLKRASALRPSGQWKDNDFAVLADRTVVGRI
jgi:hypothetical protein